MNMFMAVLWIVAGFLYMEKLIIKSWASSCHNTPDVSQTHSLTLLQENE
jgi:hypothetical protein